MTTYFNDPRIGRVENGKTVRPTQTIDGKPCPVPKINDNGDPVNVFATRFDLGDGYFAGALGILPRNFDVHGAVDELRAKVNASSRKVSHEPKAASKDL